MLDTSFRQALMSDCRWLWQLRQHPTVTEQSLSTDAIPYRAHCRWYRQLLTDKKRNLDIFTRNVTLECLGYIRSEFFEDGLMLSWAIVPELQGRGLGKTMLENWCIQSTQALWAQIKPNNTASKAIAARAGFDQNSVVQGVELWRRPPISHLK